MRDTYDFVEWLRRCRGALGLTQRAFAQRLGYAEADPAGDVEGYDAAAKALILANVLMDAGLSLSDVERTGIAGVTTAACAWRWLVVARGLGVELSPSHAIAAYYRSQFLNTVLPGGLLGDVHRGVDHGRAVGRLSRGLRAVAWERVAGNKGARTAGVDRATVAWIVSRYGVQAFLHDVREQLRSRTFTPAPVRQVCGIMAERFMRQHGGQLAISHVVYLEARNVFSRNAGEVEPGEWRRLVSDFNGLLYLDPMNWDALRRDAFALFAKYSSRVSIGTLDMAILASARLSGATRLLSFDETLKVVATAERLAVFPPLATEGKRLLSKLR